MYIKYTYFIYVYIHICIIYVLPYRSTYDMDNRHIVENLSLGEKICKKSFYGK